MALEAPAPPRPPAPRVLGIDPGSRTTGWATMVSMAMAKRVAIGVAGGVLVFEPVDSGR